MRPVIVVALLVSAAQALAAIGVRLETASSEVTVGEPFYVQVQLEDAASGDCRVDFPGHAAFTFREAGISQNQSVQVIGSRVTRTTTWSRNYMVVAKQAGQFTIGPATCVIGGQSYRTETLTLNVVQQSARPKVRRGNGFFNFFADDPFGQEAAETEIAVETVFDTADAWVGQQVLHYVDVYASQPALVNVQFAQISRTGFWEIPPDGRERVRPERVTREGRDWYRYRYTVGFLFPLTAGTKTVEPFAVRVDYDQFWTKSRVFQTAKLGLAVRALPVPAPAGFSGAVGEFTLRGQIEGGQTNAVRDRPCLLRVTVGGRGNIQTLGNLDYHAGTNFRVMTPLLDTKTFQKADGQHGERGYRFMVYPLATGRQTLPVMRLPVFNTKKGAYEVLEYAPGTLVVADAPRDTAAAVASSGTDYDARLRLDVPDGSVAILPVPQGLVLVLLAGSGLALALAFRHDRRRRNRAADPVAWRARNAAACARRALQGCGKAGREKQAAIVEDALRNYVCDRTGSGRQATLAELEAALVRAGVGCDDARGWRELAEQCVALRFAPAAGGPDDQGKSALVILDRLEKGRR